MNVARWVKRALLAGGSTTAAIGILCLCEVAVRAFLPNGIDQGSVGNANFALAALAPCGAIEHLGAADRTFRLAVVGESSGFFLGQKLEDGAPLGNYRFANCAQPASSLEQTIRRFQEVAAAKPDAVVIVFGHNLDFISPADRFHVSADWLRAHSQLINLLLQRDRAPHETTDLPSRLSAFESFLREAAKISRARGFRLIVTTVTPNLWLWPPQRGGPVDEIYRARYTRAVRGHEEGRAILTAAVDASVPAEFELALWQHLDGDSAAARQHLMRVLERDPIRRAPPAANALIRRVTQEEHLLLRDTLAIKEAAASDHLPGWESVIDNCHLSSEGFAVEAQEVLKLLGVDGNAIRVNPVRSFIKEYGRFFVQSIESGHRDGDLSADEDVAVFLWRLISERGAVEDTDLNELIAQAETTHHSAPARARLLTDAAQAFLYLGRTDRALEVNAMAREIIDPESAAAWTQFGLMEAGEHRAASATAAFQRALELNPALADAKAYLSFSR